MYVCAVQPVYMEVINESHMHNVEEGIGAGFTLRRLIAISA